jgi:hypothetical protein
MSAMKRDSGARRHHDPWDWSSWLIIALAVAVFGMLFMELWVGHPMGHR